MTPPAKAIIIAAGLGSRLNDLTRDCPKCLLPVDGVSILEHQLRALRANGVNELAVIKGYLADKLDVPGAMSYLNDNYPNNNILCSLMYAEPEMDGPFIASYSDILYTADVVKALVESPHDIALVVDTDWRSKYEGRTLHPESEAEKAAYDNEYRLLELGKRLHEHQNPPGEFIGLFKCSTKGAQILKEYFHQAKADYTGKPFINAPVFEKAYITDMMMYLIKKGVSVHAVPITEGWMEIDTPQDLERAAAWVKLGVPGPAQHKLESEMPV